MPGKEMEKDIPRILCNGLGIERGRSSIVSGIILAGGRSSRMGADKAFLKVGGGILIEGIIRKLSQLSQEIIIVSDSPLRYERFKAKLVEDIYPGRGALGGIYSGLKEAESFHSLVVACDMPFLNLSLLGYMLTLRAGYDVVLPRLGEYREALHTIYSQRCLFPLKKHLEEGRLKILDFLPQVRVRYVEEEEIALHDPQHLSFFNINTLADLELAHKIAAEGVL